MTSDKLYLNQNKKYLETHNVTKYIEELMAGLMKDKPDEPLLFMMKFIHKKAQQNGIYLPENSGVEISNNDGDQRLHARTYDKPWLSGSLKKGDDKGSLHQIIVKDDYSQNNLENNVPSNVSTNLGDEFHLVSTPLEETRDKDQIIEENYQLLKQAKSQIGTKEMLLQIVKEEEEKKTSEKLKLQEKINEKDGLCDTPDCAVELAEDPDVCQNEFNVSNPTVTKPGTAIVVRKQIVSPANGSDVNAGFKLSMCPNCTKFYQFGDSNGSVNNYSSPPFGNSVILDDLESASQVNGPRPINDISTRQNRPPSSKKMICVTDIESSAKGWPVLDSGSELSTNKRNNPRSRASARQFQS